jgi:hypothetical protein
VVVVLVLVLDVELDVLLVVVVVVSVELRVLVDVMMVVKACTSTFPTPAGLAEEKMAVPSAELRRIVSSRARLERVTRRTS